jgi:hypothetical protein
MPVRIAFCTTCKGRTQHLKLTLPKNLADNAAYPNAVFVVLDYNSDDDIQQYLWGTHLDDIKSGRLVIYSYLNGGKWLIAHAKNMAIRCGMLEHADIICTLDADNFTGPDFAQFIADKFNASMNPRQMFLYPDFAAIKRMPWDDTRPRRGFAGRLAMYADSFVKIGGYDEIFKIWGSEDIDMLGRLNRAGYTGQFFDSKDLQVISHGPEVRFKEYPEAQNNEHKWHSKQIDMRIERVVNDGNFGCGMVYKSNGSAMGTTPIELQKLPTRIFGIGMQKTGTNSLHEAFKVLGFDSFHWGTGQAALMWYEMQALGRSKTLERWYAFSDNPFPLLYEKLDKAYPGSKFILTCRNESDWLKSVERLWSYEHNPDRGVWDIYPFSNTIHTELYGQKDFDARVFLQRYRRHNLEVRQYFRNRPEDLLVMDMDAGMEWAALCKFLNRRIPEVLYPRLNCSEETIISGVSI